MKLRLAQNDLFFNVAGGLRLSEPACDLAAAAAIWSSSEEVAFPATWVFVGELGLTGEVRRVGQLETRLREAAKLGFDTAVVPKASLPQLKADGIPGMRLIGIEKVSELTRLFRSDRSSREG
jgi:DNA repair protein RadA/Sms